MTEPYSPMREPITQPDCPPYGILMQGIRFMANVCLKISGWRISGAFPKDRKMVLVGGPHTSNWDFVMMCLCAMHLRVRTNWIGKDALFKPPFGWIMRRLGGISVNRSKANDTVSQVVEHFENHDDMILVITPEGTRGKVQKWKSGFYWMAKGANVPIVLFYADYKLKILGCGPVIQPSGDYEADVAQMKAFMATKTPKNPDRIAKT